MADKSNIQASEPASKTEPKGVAAGRVAEATSPGTEHKRLNVFVGKWINESQTSASTGAPAAKILVSDIEDFAPNLENLAYRTPSSAKV